MRRLVMIAALSFVALAARDAIAQEPVWGYFVEDDAGEFVTGAWPKKANAVFGSDDDVDVVLEGLEDEHFEVHVRDGEFVVDASGSVSMNGEVLSGATTVPVGVPIRAGRYVITFQLVAESATEPVDTGEPPVEMIPRPSEAAARAAVARKDEFDRQAYRFCHDEDFAEGGVVGADFCVILDESSHSVCPAAKKTCPWTELELEATFGRFQDSAGKGRRRGAGGRKRASKPKRKPITIPGLPPVVAYAVLGLILAVLIVWFVRQLKDAGWERSEIDLAEDEIDAAALNLQSLPEARSHVLLKLADRALARGETQEAAVLLHLAILRHLDDEGLARYHPSKTNGDYLRSIRRHKPIATLFKGVATETERVRFGDGHVDVARVRELLGEGRQLLVPGSQIPTPFAGPAAILMLVALGAGAQGCPAVDENKAFYSHGPAGLAAFPALLRKAGLEPEIKFVSEEEIPWEVKTVVFRTSATRTGKMPPNLKFDQLLDRGVSVVIIDDLGHAPFFLPNTSTIGVTVETVDAVELVLPLTPNQSECQARFDEVAAFADRNRVKLPRGHRISWTGENGASQISEHPLKLEPLLAYRGDLSDGSDAVAFTAQRHRADAPLSGCLYVFSDRDLFSNASLTRRANARFVAAFFSAIASNKRIWIVDSLDRWSKSTAGGDADPDDPMKKLRASNLLPLLLQGLLSLGLLYVFLGAAFGPLRDPVHTEHKAFVEHVEAIGRQYARCGVAGLNHSAGSLARLVVMRNRERVRTGGGGWAAAARELAEKHDLPEEDVRAALRLGIEGKSELGAPRIEDPAPSSERMLRTLSRLLGGRHASLTLKPRRPFGRGKEK